jgi:hypothetical protein
MDTRPDGEDNSTVNNQRVPDYENKRRSTSLGDIDASHTMVSALDNRIQSSRASPHMGVKRTSTLPPNNIKKRHRRPGRKHDKNHIPSPELSGERGLKRLLTAGESHSMPIDVEAVDMLMRNFPITEEHQVRFAGADVLNPYLIISERTGLHKRNFLIRCRQTSKRIVFLPAYCVYTMNFY